MKDRSSDEHQSLVWIDIETTGFNPRRDAIMEIGVTITPTIDAAYSRKDKPDLGVLYKKSWVFRPSTSIALNAIDPYVINMHVENGLLAESMTSTKTLGDVIPEICHYIQSAGGQGSPMCGSTINFDRGFLKEHALELHQVFHYRNLDVSSIENMFRNHIPSVPLFSPNGDPEHRTLSDLTNSIAKYEYYLTHILSGEIDA